MATTLETSTGHVAFIGEYEYFYGLDGSLYRAPIHHSYIDVFGYRSCARFEATRATAQYALDQARTFASEEYPQ